MDSTFETNRLGLTLLMVIGITNTGKSFPGAYSFYKSESKTSFDFLFKSLNYFIFTDNIAVPRVVLADQAAGLIASMPEAMPRSKLQHCGWHIAQNIKKRLAEKRYLAEERKAIMNLVWFYIQSSSDVELNKNRTTLLNSLRNNEQAYIYQHWCFCESQFISNFTKNDPNLGYNST